MKRNMFPKSTGTYGIIAWSGGLTHDATTTCVICQKIIPFASATAGPLFADKHQAFACGTHIWNRATWLREWAKFEIRQRRARKLAGGGSC